LVAIVGIKISPIKILLLYLLYRGDKDYNRVFLLIIWRKNKMPICGFNEKMLEGLTAFSEGLIEHGLKFRCEKNGETIEQGIKRELSDMLRLTVEIDKIEDSAKRILTEGIVKYSMGFYLLTRKKGIDNYREDISVLMKYFKNMDSKYYGELEGRAEDMKELVSFLDKQTI
jgi:hypothetical protein